MKTLILAGGLGTRLSEETVLKPKPMVEIGNKPILWHVMKIYSHYGFNDFVILLGYKGYSIKEYFANYFLHQSDVTIDVAKNEMQIHKSTSEPWKVTLIDTGLNTMTGGRIKKVQDYVGDEPFMLTYGDGVCNVDVSRLVDYHNSHKGFCTMTAIQPEGRFGALEFASGDRVASFNEKPKGDGTWVNGGFFVCDSKVFDYIPEGDDSVIFERGPLEGIVEDEGLVAFKHDGFWKCMDTVRDHNELCGLWDGGDAPWKVWK